MALRHPRWIRSARRRPWPFLTILLLSAGAVLVSAVTPMLIAAVDATTLREGVADAPFPSDGISITTLAQTSEQVGNAQATVFGALQAEGLSDRWGPMRTALEPQLPGRVDGLGQLSTLTLGLTVALGGCDGLRVTGRCPSTVTEVLVPASVARTTGWRAGTGLAMPLSSRTSPLGLDVVGVYDDAAGRGRVLADPSLLAGRGDPQDRSNLVVGDSELDLLEVPYRLTGAIRIDRPVRSDDLPGLRAVVRQARLVALDADGADVSAVVRTELPALLRAIGRQQSASAVLAAPVGIEALVLAWFALAAVAQRTARARAAEWGIGRMRGARVHAWLGAVFVEPLVAVLAGAVLGFPVAVLVARLVAAVVLRSPEDVAPLDRVVLIATALGVLGSVTALVVASARAATLPLRGLLQDTVEPRRTTRLALAAQVAAVSFAVAVCWSAFTTPDLGGPQLGLLLPVLLAMIVGLAAVRGAVLVVRRAARRAPGSLGALVVGRGLARAPSALVTAQLVLVSVALTSYTVQVALASATVQTERAELAVGAARVLTVRVPDGISLLQVVRRADPTGRVALAAADLGDDDQSGGERVTAVDTTRLGAISTWRPEWRGGLDLARLRPATGEDLELRGGRMVLSLGDVTIESGDGPASTQGLDLQAVLAGSAGWQSIDFGPIRGGTLRAPISCTSGCRLVALAVHDPEAGAPPWGAQFTLRGIATDRQPATAFASWLRPARWRDRVLDQVDPSRPARIAGTGAAAGLAVDAKDSAGTSTAQLEPAVGPVGVPAVAGSDALLEPFAGVRGAVSGSSLDGTPGLLLPIGRAPALPRSLREGVLVDLATMERAADPTEQLARQQVWLTAGEHPAVLAAIRKAGVRVLEDQRASDAVDAGLRSGTNRALVLAGATALIGLLFGLLAMIGARVIDMPERRREWATLRRSGVEEEVLRRLALLQMAAPAAVGAVLGVVAGSVAAGLLIGRLPLLVGVRPGPPFDGAPPVLVLAALAITTVLAVGGISFVVTRVEVRGAGR